MRLQKQLKLFLSYFLQVSIVRGSVVTPWLSARKMFIQAQELKKDMPSRHDVNHVTANSILEQCRTFKKLAFLGRLYQRELKIKTVRHTRSPASR